MCSGLRSVRAVWATTRCAPSAAVAANGGSAVWHRRDNANIHTPLRLTRQSRLSHRYADHHRAVARDVPRGGVVNARRPGRRPGGSEAKSIDDAEPGASIESAMVRRPDLDFGSASFRVNKRGLRAPEFLAIHRLICSAKSGHEHMHTCGAFVVHVMCARTVTCGMPNDGVNDPVSGAWGHPQGTAPGSFTPSLVHRLRH